MVGTLVDASPEAGTAPVAHLLSPRRLAIATDHCKGCGLCIEACPPHVLELDRDQVNALGYNPVVLLDNEGCTSCARCARVCPDAVFTVFAPRPHEASA
jgi:2-oxoglutarate ferredoxin oxidoreductase subunit delta